MRNPFKRRYFTADEAERKLSEFESKNPMFTQVEHGKRNEKVREYMQWVDTATGLPVITFYEHEGASDIFRELMQKEKDPVTAFSRTVDSADDPIKDLLAFDRSVEDLVNDKENLWFGMFALAVLARTWLYREFWSEGESLLDKQNDLRKVLERYRALRGELKSEFTGFGGQVSQPVEELFFDRGVLGYYVLGVALLERQLLPRSAQMSAFLINWPFLKTQRGLVRLIFRGSDRSVKLSRQVSTVLLRHWPDCRNSKFTLALDFPHFMLDVLSDQSYPTGSLRKIFKDLEVEGAYLAASEGPYHYSKKRPHRCVNGCFRSRYESMARERFAGMNDDKCLVCLSMHFASVWQEVRAPHMWMPTKTVSASRAEVAYKRSKDRVINESQGRIGSLRTGYDVLEGDDLVVYDYWGA